VIPFSYDIPVTTYVKNGIKYIRTVADETTFDNLLSLDQCPRYAA
jgi:uncharacterized protein DUF3892